MKSRELPPNLILVCMGDACRKHGAKKALHALEAELALRACSDEVQVQCACCMGYCDAGPNVVLYPPGRMFGGVKRRHADALIDALLGKSEGSHPCQDMPTPSDALHVETEAP